MARVLKQPLTAAIALVAMACGGAATSGTAAPQEEAAKSTLVMAFVPSQNAQQVLTSAGPITDYLGKEIGATIKPEVPTSYAAVAEAMTSNLVDAAWVGPLDYVISHEKNGAEPMTKSVRKGVAGYNALIVTRKGSGINSITDLKGHSFAFGDVISASSSLYPRYWMRKNGIDPDKDLSKTTNISNQTAIAVAVCNGTVDAGAIYDDARTNKGANDSCAGIMDKTQVIFTTPQLIPGDPQIVRKGLNSAQKKKLVAAMLKLGTDPSMQKNLMDLFTIEKLVPAVDSDYQQIRDVVRQVKPDLLKGYPSPSPTAAPTPSPSPST